MEIRLVLHLPRDAVSVPVTRQVLDSCLETLGVEEETRADIALALSEACANVIQHAGPGEKYEVQVSAKDSRCTIEVVNTGTVPSEAFAPVADGVSALSESGRGLGIIDAVTDNLRLTGSGHKGTTLHFEKTLEWVPGGPGQHLLDSD